MRVIWRLAYIAFMLQVLHITSLHARDDIQYWSWLSFRTHEVENISFHTHFQGRFVNDAQDDGLYMVSERIKYSWSPNLQLGLNYSYLNVQSGPIEDTHFDYHHRLEAEINPQWRIWNGHNLLNRNRLEFRWIEDKGSDNTRFRQRWLYKYGDDVIVNSSFFLSNEYFYDFAASEVNENRLIPLGMSLDLSKELKLEMFYLFQSKKGVDDWNSNHIIGTHAVVSL